MYTPVASISKESFVDSNAFRKFAEDRARDSARGVPAGAGARTEPDLDYTYCPECRVPMQKAGSEYQCAQCARIVEGMGEAASHENASSSSIRRVGRNGQRRLYSVTSDYSKTQRKQILGQLINNNNAYTGPKFSRGILTTVATLYNTIQKHTEPATDASATKKKFVRRGAIKDEILCALIFYVCIDTGAARKKKDIAMMMRLPVNGFSNGNSIVRKLHNKGVIKIPIDKEPFADYVDRYMEALGIDAHADADSMRGFVIDAVALSEVEKIGMNSNLSSKIVGALYAMIQSRKLGISAAALERAADNIKKSTFMKFYKCIDVEREVFAAVYARYGMAFA